MLYEDPWVLGTSVTTMVGIIAYAIYMIRSH